MSHQYWILDFDETLVKGWDDLAMNVVIPEFIRENNLNDDMKQLNQAIIKAQENNITNNDVLSLLKDIFQEMNWPDKLIKPFLGKIQSQYKPTLFEDALPFLRNLQANNKTVYILSNNPDSTKRADNLGVLPYIEAVLTPDTLPGSPRKPDAKVWDALVAIYPHLNKENVTIVGDDPWSEGIFADACDITCWIVDRYERYHTLRDAKSYRWVHSLSDIEFL